MGICELLLLCNRDLRGNLAEFERRGRQLAGLGVLVREDLGGDLDEVAVEHALVPLVEYGVQFVVAQPGEVLEQRHGFFEALVADERARAEIGRAHV